jgi:N-methylhydantoinase A/oxoprolinase/acetone carboxylase beta subunit
MATTIDIDTGGTFTDAFVVRDGDVHTAKVLTTPHDLALCFAQVVEAVAEQVGEDVPTLLRSAACVRYATTVGTNAVIQRTGPRLGLLRADGQEVPDTPFLDADMIADVGPPPNGHDPVVEAGKGLLARSARALVCSLPGGPAEEERAVRTRFEAHYPRHCLDAVPLLLSHEVAADPDDARRTATALFNAYVHPDVARYLYRAEDWLREHGYRRPLLVVHNDGGCARVAKTIAGRTYNSGPMAGLMGAEVVAELYGIDHLLTLDMGGTSLDVAVLRDRRAPIREHGEVEGTEVSFSLGEVLALGAGGGSIAHVADGELRVGPQSAGARPGPACFGFGGTEPTTTDADVVLGIIDPERFLGGTMPLDADRAHRALEPLAEQLGADVRDVAVRIRETVHRDMGARIAGELRERGVEPAATTILAYGGAGAGHACGIAEELGVTEIVTLPFAAVFSAFGASSADVRHEYLAPDAAGAEDALRTRALRDMRGEGFAADAVDLEVDRVQRHGEERVRVRATAPLEHFAFTTAALDAGDAPAAGRREVTWPGHGPLDTAICDAAALTPGHRVAGPAVIEAADTTCAVPPGWSFRVDEHGNGRLTKEQR